MATEAVSPASSPTTPQVPATIKAWQYTSASPSLDKTLKLVDSVPLSTLGANESLVKIEAASLNPVDYKLPESVPFPVNKVFPSPATPGADFAGVLVSTNDPKLKQFEGQRVFGHNSPAPKKHGALGEYSIIQAGFDIYATPSNIPSTEAATFGIAAKTAYQCIIPFLGSEDAVRGTRIFVNGGSGGVGIFVIQIAKALGAIHVSASCSTGNVEIVQSLGVDNPIDYKKSDIGSSLKEEVGSDLEGKGYDLVVDCVGQPESLYKAADDFLKASGQFVQIGASPSLGTFKSFAQRALQPRFLGGGKSKWKFFSESPNREHHESLARLMGEGKVKAVIAKTFPFGEAPQAYEMLKKGSGNGGKIVVDVTQQ